MEKTLWNVLKRSQLRALFCRDSWEVHRMPPRIVFLKDGDEHLFTHSWTCWLRAAPGDVNTLLVHDAFAFHVAKQILAGAEKIPATKFRRLSVYLRWDTVNIKSIQVIIECSTLVAAEITGGPRRCKNVTYGTRSVCYGGLTAHKFSAH